MKLKNIKVGDTLEVKSSIVDEETNDKLSPDMLCEVAYVEPPQYGGELTVQVISDGDNVEWVNHRHLRKPKQLTGSDLTRKMLAGGESGVLCYVSDTSDYQAVKGRITKEVVGYKDGWFITNGIIPWLYAVPVEEAPDEEVTPLSRWKHSNGSTYAVILITNEHSETQDRYPTTIVYRDCNYEVWSKPLSDWHRSMTKMED